VKPINQRQVFLHFPPGTALIRVLLLVVSLPFATSAHGTSAPLNRSSLSALNFSVTHRITWINPHIHESAPARPA